MKELTEKEKEAVRVARNAYQRQYYKKNKEKHKEAMKKYWLKKAMAEGLI